MPTEAELLAQVTRLSAELDKRIARHAKVEPYIAGECPLPAAITEARLTKVYRYLTGVAEAPFGDLVVGAKLDRLEVSGVRDKVGGKSVEEAVWDAWQENNMDSESKLGHGAALLDGRCYATVWPDTEEPTRPDIALDDVTQMVVEYAEGSRKKRTGALRRWKDGDSVFATLYRADGLYKYQSPKDATYVEGRSVEWEKRKVDGEDWPEKNPLGVVPVVEIAVNRRLKPGRFAYARGEFEHCTGLIDRINLLTFLGLVVAFTQGFPLRGVLGAKIRRKLLVDDDGDPIMDEQSGKQKSEPIPPFDNQAGSVFQFDDENARIAEFSAADRKNLSVFAELDQLAVITKTPRHYFPLEQGMSNLSAEAIMASEGAMHAGVTGHKATLGEGWEEVLRLCGIVKGVTLSGSAQLDWKDHESRSLAERADAATKLKDILPWQALAERVLNANADDIQRWASQRAADPLSQIVASLSAPSPNGNGVVPAGLPTG